ncbi:MAG: hypothetical protein QM780_00820 [Hyphomicrobium sp.]|uniref:hypothetical protein n=1 Tax=Hyphomicrobium sp. TaxID=82 RepID=UPI0039E4FC85
MMLKTPTIACLGLLTLSLLATPSVAESPENAGDRFALSPVDGGVLRLDKQTGAVSMCAKSAEQWSCKAVSDETAIVPANAITRLEAENRDLKARVKELEDLLETRPPGKPLDGPLADGPPGGVSQLPSEEEVDQALDYMSRVYKKIRDHIKDLDKPLPPDGHTPPPPPAPDASPAPKGAL